MQRDRHELPIATAIGEMNEWTVAPAVLLEALPDAVVASDRDGRIVFANGRADLLFGYPPGGLVGLPVYALWPERLRDGYAQNMRQYFAAEDPLRLTIEAWGIRRDGTEFVGEMSRAIVSTSRGPLMLAIGRDVTARRMTETRLRAIAALGERALGGADAQSLAAEAVQLIASSLPIHGADVRLSSGAVLASTGTTPDPGLRISIGTGGDALHLALDGELVDEELWLVRALANTLAVALQRLRGEERARHDAMHDPLTGLANRTLLADRLRHAVARAQRGTAGAAVLFVDLDHFKEVNDRDGHAAGDRVLVELAHRLRGAVRPGDTIARYGGDEFVAVCEEVDEAAAMIVGVRILQAIHRPVRTGETEHRLSASIGIALGAGDAEALLGDADAAAYLAKANGRGRVELA